MKKTEVSIVIVSYNTSQVTLEAVISIVDSYPQEVKMGLYEIVVVDNASSDDSVKRLEEYKKKEKIEFLSIIASKENLGFAKANNLGVKKTSGRYVFFLNPDTVMYPETIPTMVRFMNDHPDAGAISCQVNVPSGGIDEASHRGFPTPWNGFCHFSGLERLFPHSRLFAGYTQGWKDLNAIHKVDAIVGACMLVTREAGEKIGWWDEDYFFYGEDLDFCYMLKEKGYSIYYVPTVHILHYGGVSIGIKKYSTHKKSGNREGFIRKQNTRFEAMRIFYKKHYMDKYPGIVNWLVLNGIDLVHKYHILKG